MPNYLVEKQTKETRVPYESLKNGDFFLLLGDLGLKVRGDMRVYFLPGELTMYTDAPTGMLVEPVSVQIIPHG